MKYVLLFAELIPLFLFYVFFVYSDSVIWFSTTYLGKLIAIAIIVFYTSIHWIYGLFICILIILYYQSDIIEGMQPNYYTPIVHPVNNNSDLLDPVDIDHKTQEYAFINDFTQVNNQTVPLRSITESKLTTQEEIMYPKTSDDWVYGIWKSWFIDSYSKPYPEDYYTSYTSVSNL